MLDSDSVETSEVGENCIRKEQAVSLARYFHSSELTEILEQGFDF